MELLKNRMIGLGIRLVSILSTTFLITLSTQAAPSFSVQTDLLDIQQLQTLGLNKPDKLRNITIFKALEGQAQYNHGAVLFAFNDLLFVQWQSSKQDEDAADTKILYSTSSDGLTWQPAKELVASRSDALVTNGGWWSDGNTLIAFINVWPHQLSPKGGYVEYIQSNDGINWSSPKAVLDAAGNPLQGIIEQDLRTTSNGTILTALHTHPGLIAKPIWTSDPLAVSGWHQAQLNNLPFEKETSREIEPSWFETNQGLTMIFRDQASSFKVLASSSIDGGKIWSTPELTNLPDARAKLSAGNLPDGTAFIVNCPSGNKQRMPLVLWLSKTGTSFNQAYLIRDEWELTDLRFAGKYKRTGFSYPKSFVWKDALWVGYSVNKEDITVSKIELDSLMSP